MKPVIVCIISTLIISTSINAKVSVRTQFQRDIKGFPEAKVHNLMNESLACYVALDGYKRKFILPPSTSSRWFTATDTRFDYSGFSTWCDYLSLHPEYEKYRAN